MNVRNTTINPWLAKFNAKIAMIGEKSIMPIGGMILRKISKYGSVSLESNWPKLDSFAFGSQLSKMLAMRIYVYIWTAIKIRFNRAIIGLSCTSFYCWSS